MKFFRKQGGRTYMFADDIIAKDTMISFIFGILAILVYIICLIVSIAKKGQSGEKVGVFLAASFIMSITALLFGVFGFYSPEGGTNSKRVSVIVATVGLALEIGLMAI